MFIPPFPKELRVAYVALLSSILAPQLPCGVGLGEGERESKWATSPGELLARGIECRSYRIILLLHHIGFPVILFYVMWHRHIHEAR